MTRTEPVSPNQRSTYDAVRILVAVNWDDGRPVIDRSAEQAGQASA